MKFILAAAHLFWERNPALLYGLCFLIGVNAYLNDYSNLLIPSALIFLPLLPAIALRNWNLSLRLALAAIVLGSGLIYAIAISPSIKVPLEGIFGKGRLILSSLALKRTSTGPRWFADGTLKTFHYNENSKATYLPIKMMFSGVEDGFVPSLSSEWEVNGVLKNSQKAGTFLFKADKKKGWKIIGSSWLGFIAQWRQFVKDYVKEYILTSINSPRSGPFLAGMVTGDFDDIVLKHHFGRFGLQHILAISGFHFSLLALALSFFLRIFIPTKAVAITLLFFLTAYFLMLGPTPSILRAWLTITLATCATLAQRRSAGLNLLGIALLFVVFIDPWSSSQLGFQCSFAITAAILIFSQSAENILTKFIPDRPLDITSLWDTKTQHFYVMACGIRSTLALTLAVNLIAIPILIFHFQSFPLYSLIYNLFFPFFVSLSVLLLIAGTFCDMILSFFGKGVHWVNSVFTDYIVGIAIDSPSSMDLQIKFPEIHPGIIIALTTFIFAWGFLSLGRKESQKNNMEIIF